MDNNGQAVAPAPAKKSHVGLIIGLVVALLVVIGGFLAAFFLWIKPTFIDGASGGNSEEKEEKTTADVYGAYLKKNYKDEEVEISFIDFNNDDTPELIVKDGSKILEIATVNEKNKVESVEIKKEGEIVLAYDVATSKERWYFVYEGYSTLDYYELATAIENGELGSSTKVSGSSVNSEYPSLDAKITYEEVDSDSFSKTAKSMLKEDKNYSASKTVSDIKTELENLKKEHKIICTGKVDTDDGNATMKYEFSFKNNKVSEIKFTFDQDVGMELTTDQQKVFTDSMKQTLGTEYNITMSKVSGTTYRITATISAADFIRTQQLDFTADEFTWDKAQSFVTEFESSGNTCTIE